MSEPESGGLFGGVRRLTSGALDNVVLKVAGSDPMGGAIDEVLAGALPKALDQLEDNRDGLVSLVDGLLPDLLPLIMARLADHPEQLTKVVDALLPDLLPLIMGRLADNPAQLTAVVDALLPDLLPLVFQRLAKEPAQLTAVVDALLPDLLPLVFQRLADDPAGLMGLLDAILADVLDRALPMALASLNDDPEPVRQLIWGQSSSLAVDVAVTVRSRALALDDTVDRLVRFVTFRRIRPAEQVTS